MWPPWYTNTPPHTTSSEASIFPLHVRMFNINRSKHNLLHTISYFDDICPREQYFNFGSHTIWDNLHHHLSSFLALKILIIIIIISSNFFSQINIWTIPYLNKYNNSETSISLTFSNVSRRIDHYVCWIFHKPLVW